MFDVLTSMQMTNLEEKKKKEVMLHIVYKQQLLKNNDLTNGLRPFFMTSCYKHSSSVICSVLFLIF